jgi:hypothetical protein
VKANAGVQYEAGEPERGQIDTVVPSAREDQDSGDVARCASQMQRLPTVTGVDICSIQRGVAFGVFGDEVAGCQQADS